MNNSIENRDEKCAKNDKNIFQDKIRLLQDDLESEREIRQRVSEKNLEWRKLFNS